MSVSSEITRIKNAKASLKTSINSKTDSQHQITTETIDDYADFVDSIQTGGGQPNLQTKSVTITTNGNTVVTADSGYDGLDEVDITTNVSGGGDVPTKGVVFADFDSNGYPLTANYYGTLTQQNYFNGTSQDLVKNLKTINILNDRTSMALPGACFQSLSFLESVNIPSQIVTIGAGAFQNCLKVELTLPSNLQTIQSNAFQNCLKLKIPQLPETVTTINNNSFYGCSALEMTKLPDGLTSLGQGVFRGASISIKTIPSAITDIYRETFYYSNVVQMSMENVATIAGPNSSTGAFGSNSSLKAVWIGSAITSAGFGRYVFYNCTNMIAMYIDLPRATVEAFTYYNYAFMNNASKVGIIICNDDAGFMTKAEFDAIDWSTYTP